MSTSPAKKSKTTMKIGTHSGTFHADESLAVYMLRLLPRFADAEIVRSRDQAVLEECDVIVDVTGQYDGVKFFDHHQREFTDTFSADFHTRLSSAGLVYKHFGKEIIAEVCGLDDDAEALDTLYLRVYKNFVEAIDANDNGVDAYPTDISPKFKPHGITLPSLVSQLNPFWTEPSDDDALMQRFLIASDLMGTAFKRHVESQGKSWLPAKQFVQKAFADRFQYDNEGRIIVFDDFVPWKEHLFEVERDAGMVGKVLYVLYSDGKGWRIQAVPEAPTSFQSRKALPEAWRGARDEKLDAICGIDGSVFVHVAGFIGGNKTRQGALDMAKLALAL
ncbi:metal-dependent protein hydrolase [Nadsonia fulvescens var. elongata DSM 6958]|uniref:Metal-dependent protein hydrolase n=1 Tax=Nadsonia fulvescens var. elongata DSM 6958 TaxID=857566 RepID=A0A1E3PGC2_9ASCO|nr:metal-dependent protein hydrolase [Nadsonia fulvescens var. elongata DSM 6958]